MSDVMASEQALLKALCLNNWECLQQGVELLKARGALSRTNLSRLAPLVRSLRHCVDANARWKPVMRVDGCRSGKVVT